MSYAPNVRRPNPNVQSLTYQPSAPLSLKTQYNKPAPPGTNFLSTATFSGNGTAAPSAYRAKGSVPKSQYSKAAFPSAARTKAQQNRALSAQQAEREEAAQTLVSGFRPNSQRFAASAELPFADYQDFWNAAMQDPNVADAANLVGPRLGGIVRNLFDPDQEFTQADVATLRRAILAAAAAPSGPPLPPPFTTQALPGTQSAQIAGMAYGRNQYAYDDDQGDDDWSEQSDNGYADYNWNGKQQSAYNRGGRQQSGYNYAAKKQQSGYNWGAKQQNGYNYAGNKKYTGGRPQASEWNGSSAQRPRTYTRTNSGAF